MRVLRTWRMRRYLAKRAILATAPYPVDFYANLLGQLALRKDVAFRAFGDGSRGGGRRRSVYVRHDIDTAACVRKLDLLLDVDRSFGICAGLYFLVNGEPYDLAAHREQLRLLREQEFEVGLHSTCYLEEDFVAALRREIAAFEAATGFVPESITFHGLGSRCVERRREAARHITAQADELGFRFTDCNGVGREYGYVIEDCRMTPDSPEHHLFTDFVRPPHCLPLEQNWLVLAHPCYWGPEGRP